MDSWQHIRIIPSLPGLHDDSKLDRDFLSADYKVSSITRESPEHQLQLRTLAIEHHLLGLKYSANKSDQLE